MAQAIAGEPVRAWKLLLVVIELGGCLLLPPAELIEKLNRFVTSEGP